MTWKVQFSIIVVDYIFRCASTVTINIVPHVIFNYKLDSLQHICMAVSTKIATWHSCGFRLGLKAP